MTDYVENSRSSGNGVRAPETEILVHGEFGADEKWVWAYNLLSSDMIPFKIAVDRNSPTMGLFRSGHISVNKYFGVDYCPLNFFAQWHHHLNVTHT